MKKLTPFTLPAAAIILVFLSHAHSQTVTRGPNLQVPTQNSIVVKWRTDTATDSKVSYGTDQGNLSLSAINPISATEHTVQLTGLTPFTKYYYSIGSTTQTLSGPSPLHHFTTNPVPGTVQPIRIWAIGDFGKANTTQNRVRDAYLNYSGNTHTDVWLWLGDNVYDSGTDQEYQTKVFDTLYYGKVFWHMPFWPCPGNHDYESISPPFATIDPASPSHTGPYYDIFEMTQNGEAGGVPSGRELYYSCDYGNVHFVSLNSELGSVVNASHDWTGANLSGFSGSPMTQWLEQDLQANTQTWVIVYFHQPPYTKGSHDSDAVWERYMIAMRETFVPIFDQYGVDMVVCGHSHVYERSKLMKGHTGNSSTFDPNVHVVSNLSGNDSLGEAYVKDLNEPNGNDGTMYVVCGSSGSLETGAALNHPAMHTGYADKGGSFIIDVDGNRLDCKFLNEDGLVLDHFTMKKIDTTSTAATEAAEYVSEFTVYPNPFKDETTVIYTLKKNSDVQIELFDLNGKKIKTIADNKNANPGSYSLIISESDLGSAKGVYLLRLHVGDGDTMERIIKVN